MKIGIMQPYFFPYLGYISLIKHTDEFMLFDPVQFIRHGWIERNRILKPGEGWQYISVPLQKHEQTTKIQDIKVDNSQPWQDKLIAQLAHYKKRAPFYNQTLDVIKSGLTEKTDSITKLNYNTLKSTCQYLDIPFNCSVFSERNLKIEPAKAPDEWALNICKALKYAEYWNPPGGMDFFDAKKYEDAGIKLVFQKPILEFYSQRRGPENFIPGLSIIDVMMFNDVPTINQMLNNYELITKSR
ncbi:MAG: WbqC family protein [Alphaproteobacteria bacterium]|nr:WbqC family protein [Alphaproteobacteria bacterium]